MKLKEDKICQEFIFKKIDEIRNYFLEEVKQNYLMRKKHKKVCTTLNYTEHILILLSTISGCVSIPVFALLVGLLIGTGSSAVRLKICAMTTGIKMYNSVTKKKRTKA